MKAEKEELKNLQKEINVFTTSNLENSISVFKESVTVIFEKFESNKKYIESLSEKHAITLKVQINKKVEIEIQQFNTVEKGNLIKYEISFDYPELKVNRTELIQDIWQSNKQTNQGPELVKFFKQGFDSSNNKPFFEDEGKKVDVFQSVMKIIKKDL